MDIEYSHKSAKHKTRRPRTHLEEPQETLDSLSPENVINGLTLAQNRMIGLQQTAGNQAVLHHMVQRQTPHLSQPQAPTPTTAAAPATAPQAPAENQMAYTIDLQLPGGARRHFERLPRDRALRELYWIAVQVGGFINTWRDSHVQMEQQFHESWLVGRVSDWLSFHERPPISIWQEPLATWARAHSQVSQGNIREATEALRTAVEQANRANHQVEDYREAAITGEHSGAQRAIIGLEVSEVVLAAIATAATAGAAGAAFAAAAGTAGAATAGATAVAGATVAAAATASTAAMVGTVAVSSAVAGVTAGAYGMIMSESGQISEHVLGLRRNFDFEAVWRRGEHDAILGFVGGIIGGGLNVALSRVATGYILANESMIVHFAEANFMDGEALFQFIYRSGPGLFSEFISFIPSNVLNTYVSNVVTGAVGDESARRQLDQESFCHQVWTQMVQGGIINMFVSFVTHRMTTVGPRGSGQVPNQPEAPTGELAAPEPVPTRAAGEPTPIGGTSAMPVEPQATPPAPTQAAPSEPTGSTPPSAPAPAAPSAPEEVVSAPQAPAPETEAASTLGGESPVSGRTLTGTTPPGEQPAGAPSGTENAPSRANQPPRFARTLSGTGGRRFIPLTRGQAQIVTECAIQRHQLRVFEDNFNNLPQWHEFDARYSEHFVHMRELVNSTRARVTQLEAQLGSPELVERVSSHTGRNHPLTREDYQNDFTRLTGNEGPAPEGGFIMDDGRIVTFHERLASSPRISPTPDPNAVASAEALGATGMVPQARPAPDPNAVASAEALGVTGMVPQARPAPDPNAVASGEALSATGAQPQTPAPNLNPVESPEALSATGAQPQPQPAPNPNPVRSEETTSPTGVFERPVVEVNLPELQPRTTLTREQAEAALRYHTQGRLPNPPATHQRGRVERIMDWQSYAASYQHMAGPGTTPPEYGFTNPQGQMILYTPRNGQLISPGEQLPPLPEYMRGSGVIPTHEIDAEGNLIPYDPARAAERVRNAGQQNQPAAGVGAEPAQVAAPRANVEGIPPTRVSPPEEGEGQVGAPEHGSAAAAGMTPEEQVVATGVAPQVVVGAPASPPVQAPANPPASMVGGENAISGQTLHGTGLPSEPTTPASASQPGPAVPAGRQTLPGVGPGAEPSSPANETTSSGQTPPETVHPGDLGRTSRTGETTPATPEEAAATRRGTLPGVGNRRPYSPLSREQVELFSEYRTALDNIRDLAQEKARLQAALRAGSSDIEEHERYRHVCAWYDQAGRNIQSVQNRIGDQALMSRLNSIRGSNYHSERGSYQEDFLRSTGDAGPAPEGGFISHDGILVVFER